MSKIFTFTTLSSDDLCGMEGVSPDYLSQVIDDILAIESNTGAVRSVINGDFTLNEIEALEKSYNARIVTSPKKGTQ